MPAGAIEQQGGMGAPGDIAADLIEVKLRGLSVWAKGSVSPAPVPGAGQMAPKRISRFVTLVRWLTGPRASPGPLPCCTIPFFW
ncbi:hypothetical protein X734_33160 [Mesorhizobium sp. L2C084A000]|nr:hypothetical protein X734_33160 [Mesorhizobium sp. L2C084A000]